ncbi:MAG: TonB family protein [Algiphilus sp.]
MRGNIKDQAISILIGLGLGIVATFLLYWFMSVLVAAGQNALTEAPQGRIVDFVRVPDPPQLRTHQPKPEKPDKPEVAPETPKLQVAVSRPRADSVNLGVMDVDTELAVDTSAGLSASDGEYLPIVKVAPIYPNRAQSRGIEGWVLLRFTVTATGSVVDPEVIDAEPPGVFDDAAKNAVVRFKYKPRVINGQARSVQGVEHLITFKMDD